MTEFDRALLSLSKDDLLFQVGEAVQQGSLESRRKSRMDKIFDAMAWLSEKREEFVKALCATPVITTHREHERAGERVVLIAAIIDLICSCTGAVPAATVAVLIANEGLTALCDNCAEGNSAGSPESDVK